MLKLRTYLNSLPSDVRDEFAARCDTTVGYLRKAISKGERIRESTCLAIERESGGAVTCEEMRPDVDWRRWRDMQQHAHAPLAPASEPVREASAL